MTLLLDPDTRPSTPTRVRAARDWVRLVLVLGARVYRVLLTGLVVVAAAPVVLGWSSYVIESGSMEPGIGVGDVVVATPYDDGDRIRVGRVFVFDNPATAAPDLMTHRIVELRDDGDYTTAGDANAVTDITPLSPRDVRGTAVLLVPYVGLPVAWARSGQWLALALWLGLTVGAFVLGSRRLDGDPPTWCLLRRTGPVLRRATVGVLVVVGVLAPTANAAFTAQTRTSGSSWTVGTWMQPYVSAVMADSPLLFWLLDETTGNQGADRSGNNRVALMTGIDLGRPGALPNNPGSSVRLDEGVDRIVSAGPAQSAPRSFSLELWFRTTDRDGGKIIGFESSQGSTSQRDDRTVSMREDGRIAYGEWERNARDVVVTPRAYDDGAWHHLVTTVLDTFFGPLVLIYVDGELVTFGLSTSAAAYTGWWRVGYGTMPSGRDLPDAPWAAEVDNVAVYSGVLSSQRVAAHYAAR